MLNFNYGLSEFKKGKILEFLKNGQKKCPKMKNTENFRIKKCMFVSLN